VPILKDTERFQYEGNSYEVRRFMYHDKEDYLIITAHNTRESCRGLQKLIRFHNVKWKIVKMVGEQIKAFRCERNERQ
jgi:hypothetical protein